MQKIKVILLTICGILLFASCQNWFDVNPKSQVKGEDLFANENGFKTALFGVYTSMNQPDLYGENLSMSFLDVLAQYYPIALPSHSFFQTSVYDYESVNVKNKVNRIWTEMYRTIMNCNNILENIDANPTVFSYHNKDLIQGELYGLRAYLHFDLLRLFAPSTLVDKDAAAIPYVDKVSRTPFQQLTSQEVATKILADCQRALTYLAVSDPSGPAANSVKRDDDFLAYRHERMNYYAVVALMARVQLWRGDLHAAKELSDQVMQQTKNSPTSLLFALYSDKLTIYSDKYFSIESTSSDKLNLSQSRRESIYEVSKYQSYDQRILNWLALDPNSVESTDGSNTGIYTIQKYTKGVVKPVNIPLIKMTEIYYINAECETDPNQAVTRLNEVRMANGIPESLNLTADKIVFDDELQKEYRKSFLAEGQFFYYLKRKNSKTIPDAPTPDNTQSVYTLPLPELEVEFGYLLK